MKRSPPFEMFRKKNYLKLEVTVTQQHTKFGKSSQPHKESSTKMQHTSNTCIFPTHQAQKLIFTRDFPPLFQDNAEIHQNYCQPHFSTLL